MPEPGVTLDDRAARERVADVERLLEQVDALADPVARDTATELVGALLDLYGEGLARVVAALAARDDDGALAAALGGDELVAHLLLLHGLHPVALEARVRGALDDVRPYLESHGGDVELLGVEGGVARLRLQGSCDGCPSSAATLKLAIEDAIHRAAPDVEAIEAEGAVEAPAGGLLQIEAHGAPAGGLLQIDVPAPRRAWATTDMPALADGERTLSDVAGEPVLFLRLSGRTYAYRSGCPECGRSLDEAALTGAELACPECGHRFDARRAGRCLDAPALHLEPVPLLTDADGTIRVALGAPA